MAKLIIRLINGVAEVVNADPAVAGRLAVAFLPDFNVTNAQPIYPAADLSEQTSTAGKEASGTGNMKFAMNGALTIGTLDGANVEIRDAVGPDNFFTFGLTVEEIAAANARGRQPRQPYEANPELREAIDQIRAGYFSRGDPSLFQPLVDALLERDDYLVLEDYQDYVACQEAVNAAYRDVAGGPRCRSSTSHAADVFLRTARSEGTARRSGTPYRCTSSCEGRRQSLLTVVVQTFRSARHGRPGAVSICT